MSSPRRTPRGTPSKQVTSPTPSGQSDSSRPQDMDVSEMSELAAPLPSSPAIPPSRGSELDLPRGGPGSVMVSEIDLSSPLNYGTPGSVGSSIKTPRTGVRGTPIRIRSDIQSDKRLRTVNLSQPEGDAVPSSAGDGLPQSEVVPPSEASETAPTMLIWGTDVSVVPCKAKFKKFVETWVDPEPDVDEMMSGMDKNAATYMQRLEEIATLENPFLDVNCGHIQNFDADLYRQLICYPQEVIPTLDMAVNEMFFERFPDTTLTHQIQVRPYSADKTKNMRTLGPEDIDQLITITGMVTRASDLIPEMAEAVFRCSVCRYTVTAELERGRIHEPTLCQHCSTNHSFSLVHNRSRVTGLDNDGTHSPHLTETDQDTEDEFSNQDEELGKEHIERNQTKRKRKKLKPTSDRKSGAQWRKITLLVDTDDSSAEEEEWTKKQNCRNPKTQEVFRRKINAQQSKLDDLPQMTECSCDTDIEVAGLKDEFPTKVKRKNCDLVIKTDFGNHVPPTKKMFTEASEHMKTEHSNVSAIPNNDRSATKIIQVDGGNDDPDADLLVPDIHDNHIAKIRDVFFKEKTCLVRLELQFFPTTNNEPQSHFVILPLELLEDNPKKVKREIRDQILGIVPFIFNLEKYCNKLVGEAQQFLEHKNKNVADKPFIKHDKPTVFEYEDVMYYNCGQLWRLSEPGHLIKLEERDELPFLLVYTGKPKEYVDDMKALVEGLLLLLDQMSKMQPVPEDHSWPFIKMSMHGQSLLYPVISLKYGQATIIVNSGDATNVGKTFWQLILDYLCVGFHDVSGQFTEKTVFDKLTVGIPFIVDEVIDYKKQGPIIQVVVSHTFNPKERSVGKGGGKPKAAFSVNCNPTRAKFNFPKNVDTKICWLSAGSTSLQTTSEDCELKDLQKKMIASALQLHVHYPNFLMLAAQCFQNPISDDELRRMEPFSDGSERLAQILINVLKFSEKLKEQAAFFEFEVPEFVKQVDFGPILVNYDDEKLAPIEDLLKYFIDNDLTDQIKFGRKGKIEGFRFAGNLVVNCPPKIYKLVSSIKSEPDKGKRWKFVRTDDVERKYLRKLVIGNLEISNAWKRDSLRSNRLRDQFEAELIASTKEYRSTQCSQSTPDPPLEENEQKEKEPKPKKLKKNPGILNFKCTACDKSFSTQKGLGIHVSAKHKK